MSAQVEFRKVFEEQFNLLVSSGLSKNQAAAQAICKANEIMTQKAREESGAMVLSVTPAPAAAAGGPAAKIEKQKPSEGIEYEAIQALIASVKSGAEDVSSVVKMVSTKFCSPQIILESFIGADTEDNISSPSAYRLNIMGVSNCFDDLAGLNEHRVTSSLSFALESLVGTLLLPSTTVASIKPFIFLLEYDGLIDPSKETIVRNLLKSFFKLSNSLKFQMFRWIYEHAGVERVKRYLSVLRQFMTIRVFSGDIEDARLATKFIGVLYDVRTLHGGLEHVLPLQDFYSDPINEEYMQSRDGRRTDFTMWSREQYMEHTHHLLSPSAVEELVGNVRPVVLTRSSLPVQQSDGDQMDVDTTSMASSSSSNSSAVSRVEPGTLGNNLFSSWPIQGNRRLSVLTSLSKLFTLSDKKSFISHPYVLTPATKALVLEFDAALQMRKVMDVEVQTAIATGQQYVVPYFVLRVRREHIVMDTISQVMLFEDTEFKKPLKIIFDDEDGVDAGGVRKEFYQVMTKQLFNPGYGMFKSHEDSRLLWFNSDSLESSQEFELVGLLLGVAIYNSIIIDLKLPLVVYKKLKNRNYKSTLADLEVLQPTLAAGLKTLLTFDGDVQATFGSNFSITYEFFGENRTVDLIEGGSSIPVTNENRAEYVDLYVNYLLDVSVEPQFHAFERGFKKLMFAGHVCGGAAVDMFEPVELELLICGNPVLDFAALREGTKYADGFEENSQAIQFLWYILLHDFNEEEKKLFLKFISGSDRSPIEGLSKLEFVISRNGTDDERLPSAHTCFNHLLLPDYSTIEIMKTKLRYAISHSEGFGLR